MDVREMISLLTQEVGPSGHEHDVGRSVAELFAARGAVVRIDALGSVIGFVQGSGTQPRRRVVVEAHLDEIGFMITNIDDSGCARFTQVGGIDPRTMLGQEVVVKGRSVLHGVIGAKPPHLQTAYDREQPTRLDQLFIDFGMSACSVRSIIDIGDVGTVLRHPINLQSGRMAAKSMDNRSSIAALLVCLEEWSHYRPAVDVYLVATVQEETAFGGAYTATYGIAPDIGIAIDVCHGEMPGTEPDRVSRIGEGPAIAMGPNIHRRIFDRIVDTAKKERIPYQVETSQGPTGTDAWAMQVVGSGVATAVISIPLRYMHTSVELLSPEDVHLTGILLARSIASMDAAFVEALSCY